MADTSEEEAVPLKNLGSSAEASTSPESEEVGDTVPFVPQEEDDGVTYSEPTINIPLLYARIRHLVHYILEHIPMPGRARSYLKVRWYGLFVSVLSILVVAVAAGVATGVLLLREKPEAPPIDPFADWAKDMGPNGRTTVRLPESLRPIQYRLFLYFCMDDTQERFHYQGRVAILVKVASLLEVNDKFLIHAHKSLDVDIQNFIIMEDNGFLEEMTNTWESFPYIDKLGMFHSGADEELHYIPKERQDFGHYHVPIVTRLDDEILEVQIQTRFEERTQKLLLIHFSGTARQNPPGIFINKIPKSDDVWLATQFQPTLARAAFPCFDEPAFRSTFYLSVAHPKKYLAMSNMARIQTKPTSPAMGKDYIWSTFNPSIPMPPYLLGFVIGPFKSLEVKRTRFIPETRIFALNQDDIRQRTVFAANVTVQAMEYAKKYFKLDFPMSKLDLVALPSKHISDSEGWGIILFSEETFMLNTSMATVELLEKVARSVIHYVIHQYVGNMVGPAWWDDLWATEALIAFIENEFLEKIFPDWYVWENFATITMGEALKIDLLEGNHAVFALPRMPYYPYTMFDALTSHKGAAIFRMLEMYSPGCIQRAVQHYLTTKIGRSVSANVLFQDIHYAIYPLNTFEDGPPIVDVVKKWTREPAYPLVSVVRYTYSADVSLYQEIFQPHHMINQQSLETHEIPERDCHGASRHQRVAGSSTAWSLPLDFVVLNASNFIRVDSFWQTTSYHRVCGGFPGRSKYILTNLDQKGYFRVDYDTGNWELIGHEMMHNPKVFSRATRAMLIDDSLAMAKLARVNFAEALMMPMALLYQGIDEELTAGDVGMYERAMRAVADVHDCLRGSNVETEMIEYMKLIVGAEWAAVNPPHRRALEKASSRNHTDILALRTSILLQEQAVFWACYTGMKACTDWAIELIEEWQTSYHFKQGDVLEEHYSNAYCAAVRHGSDSLFDFLWSRYQDSDLSDTHKREILWALLCTSDPYKILEVLGGLPGKRDLVQDTMKLWRRMENRHLSAWYAFKYERAYWTNVHSKMFDTTFFNQIIVAITSALATPDDLEYIQEFRTTHNESLWDVQDLLEDNVHNIRKRLFFRSIIEQPLKEALREMIPLVEAVKLQADNARSPTPSPLYDYTESKHEPLTPHPS